MTLNQGYLSRPRLPIARSYYNAEDAAKLIADTVEIYKASYRKIGLIK